VEAIFQFHFLLVVVLQSLFVVVLRISYLSYLEVLLQFYLVVEDYFQC
jgi:hypothetical protein